jgi:hypothetical protein
VNDVRPDDDPDRLFRLAVFSHTGPIRGDLGDAPGILLILGGPDVALVNGLRPRIAHMIAALLGEGRRRKGTTANHKTNAAKRLLIVTITNFLLSSQSPRHQHVIDNDIKQTNLIAI